MTILVRDSDGHKIETSDEAKIEKLKGLGFRVEEDTPSPAPQTEDPPPLSNPPTETQPSSESPPAAPAAEPVDYAAKTTDELRTLATFRNLAVNERTSRTKLIYMLQDSEPK